MPHSPPRSFCILFLFACSVATAQAEDISDPLEPMNRGIFWFNETTDQYLIEPVAKGYDWVVPDVVEEGVSNFFDNLRYPVRLVSSLVQLKFDQALEETGRFAVNSTLGLAGLIDVAEDMGLKDSHDDIGVALGYHGVPPGPYLVLPFLGPSNVRDGLSKIVDLFLDPLMIAEWGSDAKVPDSIVYGSYALWLINTRSGLLDTTKTAKEASLDYYLFMQGAYHQYREGLIHDGMPPDADEYSSDDSAENKLEATAPAAD